MPQPKLGNRKWCHHVQVSALPGAGVTVSVLPYYPFHISTHRYNHTDKWLTRLDDKIGDIAISLARRLRITTIAERRANLEAAHAGKFASLPRKAEAAKMRRKRLIRNLLRIEDVEVHTSVQAWKSWTAQVTPLPLD